MIASTRNDFRRDGDKMRARFDTLTVLQRQCLYMSLVDGQPTDSVARKLDLSVEAATGIIRAAREKVLAVTR